MMNNNRVSPKSASSSSASSSASSNRKKCFEGVHDCCYTEFLIQNHWNFNRSGPPTRFMSYRDGSWFDFSREAFGSLRSVFLEGKAVVEVVIESKPFLFDFYRMLQIDYASGCERSIAWIDVDGDCFFPKECVNELADSCGIQEIEIVNVSKKLASGNPRIENSRKRKRKAGEYSEFRGGDSGSSNCWSEEVKKQRLLTWGLESPKWPKAKLLKEGHKSYSIVKNMSLSGIGNGATITSIHQYMPTGPLDEVRHQVFLKQMETTKGVTARGDSNMAFAWHGTSAKGVASIFTHGFLLPNKVSAHGIGVYLSPVGSPHMSALLSEADDNGEKHVILCCVIRDKCEKVDTGVDDLKNTKWYVLRCANMNTYILPECIVSYKSSD